MSNIASPNRLTPPSFTVIGSGFLPAATQGRPGLAPPSVNDIGSGFLPAASRATQGRQGVVPPSIGSLPPQMEAARLAAEAAAKREQYKREWDARDAREALAEYWRRHDEEIAEAKEKRDDILWERNDERIKALNRSPGIFGTTRSYAQPTRRSKSDARWRSSGSHRGGTKKKGTKKRGIKKKGTKKRGPKKRGIKKRGITKNRTK